MVVHDLVSVLDIIVAHGSVGNLKKLNFLIDTRAVPSVLDGRVAKKLRLTGTVKKLSISTFAYVRRRNDNAGKFRVA